MSTPITTAESITHLERTILNALQNGGPEYCFGYKHLVKETDIPRDILKGVMASMKNRWLVRFANGLCDEDGNFMGAGHGITRDGLEYLSKLPEPTTLAGGPKYFVTGADEWENGNEETSIGDALKRVQYYFDNCGEGWPDDMESLTLWCAFPISKAVETDRTVAVDCPACLGGNIADEISETSGEDACLVCDGKELVDPRNDDPWYHDHEVEVRFEMIPPLPVADATTQETKGGK